MNSKTQTAQDFMLICLTAMLCIMSLVLAIGAMFAVDHIQATLDSVCIAWVVCGDISLAISEQTSIIVSRDSAMLMRDMLAQTQVFLVFFSASCLLALIVMIATYARIGLAHSYKHEILSS